MAEHELADARGEAAQLAEVLRAMISSLDVVHGSQTIRVSASFGVAVLSPQDANFASMIARADLALYEAKSGGRNIVVQHGSKDLQQERIA